VKQKQKQSRNRILYFIAGLVAAIFIFTAGTMALMVKDEIIEKEPDPPPEVEKEPHLYVEDVFFMQSYGYRASNDWLDLTTTVYVTNDGLADAENVKITAFPIDNDKNLALDKCDKVVGKIPAQETSEIEFSITVPSGSKHNVNLLIFERNRLILRGSGSVVIQGEYKNTQDYQTDEIRGTQNDTDYDGMADSWEIYYGLNPSDPTDAKQDKDNDGFSNLAEYWSGSEPCAPNDGDGDDISKKEEADSMERSIAFGIFVLIVVIIIIIAIVYGIVKASRDQNKSKPHNGTTPSWSNQNIQSNTYSPPNWQKTPTRCMKCGGWVINDTCTTCGGKYPINSVDGSNTINSKSDGFEITESETVNE